MRLTNKLRILKSACRLAVALGRICDLIVLVIKMQL